VRVLKRLHAPSEPSSCKGKAWDVLLCTHNGAILLSMGALVGVTGSLPASFGAVQLIATPAASNFML